MIAFNAGVAFKSKAGNRVPHRHTMMCEQSRALRLRERGVIKEAFGSLKVIGLDVLDPLGELGTEARKSCRLVQPPGGPGREKRGERKHVAPGGRGAETIAEVMERRHRRPCDVGLTPSRSIIAINVSTKWRSICRPRAA